MLTEGSIGNSITSTCQAEAVPAGGRPGAEQGQLEVAVEVEMGGDSAPEFLELAVGGPGGCGRGRSDCRGCGWT